MKYKLPSLFINVPDELKIQLKEIQKNIPKKYVKTLEKDFHITLLYGIQDKEFTRQLAEELKAKLLKITLDGYGWFDQARSEKEPTSVLFVKIKSPQLKNMHNQLKKKIKNQHYKDEFKPHLTLAYMVPKEEMDNWTPEVDCPEYEWEAKDILISYEDSQKLPIKLSRKLYTDLQSKIQWLLQNDQSLSEQDLQTYAEADPSGNYGTYLPWLVNQVKNNQIRLPEDKDKVFNLLKYFNNNKNKQDWPINKDINQLDYYTLDQTVDSLQGVDLKSKQEEIKEVKEQGAAQIYNDGEYSVIKITTPEAACIYAKNTKWCTSNSKTAEQYLNSGPLYIILKNNQKIAQFHKETDSLMDVQDRTLDLSIQDEGFKKAIVDGIWGGEDAIAKDVEYSYEYAKDVLKGRFEKGEDAIAKDVEYSYEYAKNVLKSRFEKGEDIISKSVEYSYAYALNVLKSRFEKGEDAIAKDVEYSYEYAKDVLKGRFEKGEDVISKSVEYSYLYAYDVLKSRFEKGEDAITKDVGDSYRYALNVLKGRFEKGEDAIATDARFSYLYAKYVLNDSNPETWMERYLKSKQSSVKLSRLTQREWLNQKFAELRQTYGGNCQICGSSEQLEFAHLAPTGLSGPSRGKKTRYYDIKNHPDSYCLLCKRCHYIFDQHDRSFEEIAEYRLQEQGKLTPNKPIVVLPVAKVANKKKIFAGVKDDKFSVYVDVDGTIAEYDGEYKENEFGSPIIDTIAKLNAFKANNDNVEIVIYTSRGEKEKAALIKMLDESGLNYDDVIMGKPFFDVLVDDKVISFQGDTGSLENDLQKHKDEVLPYWHKISLKRKSTWGIGEERTSYDPNPHDGILTTEQEKERIRLEPKNIDAEEFTEGEPVTYKKKSMVYPGNMGAVEMLQFYNIAPENKKREMDRAAEAQDFRKIEDLIEEVLDVRLAPLDGDVKWQPRVKLKRPTHILVEAKKLGFVTNIEDDTINNTDYRRVLYTAKESQLVLMSLQPGEEIGEEIHEKSDQFFRFESGNGKMIINDKEHDIEDGFAIVVPKGAKHNVINTGNEKLQLYAIYSPPHHKDGTVHHTKADESFVGETTGLLKLKRKSSFYDADRPKGKYTEIFINPSPTEMKEAAEANEDGNFIRGSFDSQNNMYVWRGDILHYYVNVPDQLFRFAYDFDAPNAAWTLEMDNLDQLYTLDDDRLTEVKQLFLQYFNVAEVAALFVDADEGVGGRLAYEPKKSMLLKRKAMYNKELYEAQLEYLEKPYGTLGDGNTDYFLEAAGDLFREEVGNQDSFYIKEKQSKVKRFLQLNDADLGVTKKYRDEEFISKLRNYQQAIESVRDQVSALTDEKMRSKLNLILDIAYGIAETGIKVDSTDDPIVTNTQQLIKQLPNLKTSIKLKRMSSDAYYIAGIINPQDLVESKKIPKSPNGDTQLHKTYWPNYVGLRRWYYDSASGKVTSYSYMGVGDNPKEDAILIEDHLYNKYGIEINKSVLADKTLYEGDYADMVEDDEFGYEYIKSDPGVALLLYRTDNSTKPFLGVFERVPAHGDAKPQLHALTGTIDGNDSPEETVVREAMEEAGYEITKADLISLGEVNPAKNSEWSLTMFAVDVTDKKQKEKTTDGTELEKEAYTEWVPADDFINSNDAVLHSLVMKFSLTPEAKEVVKNLE